jgi:nucleoside phosphorylase
MPNLALIVAMRTEAPYILKHATGICRIGDNAIRLAVTGIGPKKARRATQQVCTGSLGFMPDLLINAGFCGAVRNGLDVGHLIIANLIAYRDRVIRPAISLIEKAAGLLAGSNFQIGKLQTSNWPVLSRAGVSGTTLAVDMESFAIVQTAAAHQIPAIIIKAVSDIVPQHAGLLSLLSLVRSLKINTTQARARLNVTVNKIFEDQYLLDDSKRRPKIAKNSF